jgi:predicted RNA-binding protein with PIN domain
VSRTATPADIAAGRATTPTTDDVSEVPGAAWLIDGNNVFGSRPDRWWNDPQAAKLRLAQRVAKWCRTHDDPVVLVFDAPVASETLALAGGNLTIEVATRRGRDAADDHIVERARNVASPSVVTSDRGLQRLLVELCGEGVRIVGVMRFREMIGY